MLELINYCPIQHENMEQQDAELFANYLRSNELAGAELFLYGDNPEIKAYADACIGVHLRFWPEWVDFWQGNKAALGKSFQRERDYKQYYGGAENVAEWLTVIRSNISEALKLQPQYLVWHVSSCRLEECFTFNFYHSDWDVLRDTAELFNTVSDIIPEQVTVLFENLWWPGLRLVDKQLVDEFFARIEKTNVGVMLDTGHLLNTNPELADEEEAVAYLLKVLEDLGSCAALVKGMHLSCSLSGQYRKQFMDRGIKATNPIDVMQHIAKLDQHLPFGNAPLGRLMDKVQPEYLVHELFYNNLTELTGLLEQQRRTLWKR